MKKIHFDFHSAGTFINVIVICLAIIMAFSVVAQEYNTDSISLSLDNDGLLGSDRGYTNGLFLKYNSNSTVDIKEKSPFILKTIGSLLPLQQQSNKGWGITVGQQIWTPTDLTSPFEGENDRPYTGFLFIEANVFEFSAESANKYSLMLGAVGPDAFGENSQKSVHSLIGSPKPMGWGRQIENQTVFNFSYEGQRLLTRSAGWFDKDYDTGLSGRINVGNYQSEVALGSTIRWGENLEESFASVGVMPGNYIDPSVLSKSRSGQFYYLSVEARYRFQDITIDGARPKHLFDVHTEHWQATISTGAVYYQESWGLALSIITSSPDYEEDLRNYNATASIEMFWRI
ncbi:lipid A deacylase LpxR family protein [Colwellia sp. 75C3]|uniref:lipid A deacylase LpxR family protein n=1 Tax=Colwellia sp. 75C3 TaxID=888425 RepID=UPI001E323597|nr:lipid A deacylase LpxR family protein [Colwellia sp. 75C3]